jgi:hypothetical protein
VFSFNDFTPNMLPLHHGQQQGAAVWGLTIEQDVSFLRNGCHCVSTADGHPQARAADSADAADAADLVAFTHDMDFISMSHCMVPEGTELWIRVTAEVYAIILQQAQDQGSSLMLPVSQALHNSMPAKHSRYLRAFYTLGCSVHDQPLAHNQVSLVCVMASKTSVPGKKTTADDAADALSRVNQNISVDNTRFVAMRIRRKSAYNICVCSAVAKDFRPAFGSAIKRRLCGGEGGERERERALGLLLCHSPRH